MIRSLCLAGEQRGNQFGVWRGQFHSLRGGRRMLCDKPSPYHTTYNAPIRSTGDVFFHDKASIFVATIFPQRSGNADESRKHESCESCELHIILPSEFSLSYAKVDFVEQIQDLYAPVGPTHIQPLFQERIHIATKNGLGLPRQTSSHIDAGRRLVLAS